MNFLKMCIIGSALAATASNAANLLTNGDFETGDYTGWAANVQAGSNGALSIAPNNGGTSPISSFPYQLNANGGRFFSITDQRGPGSYSLTQSFTLATSTQVTISFDHFANNSVGTINGGRDFTGPANQNAIVDLLVGGADPFSDAAADLVAVFYGPGADAGATPNPWVSYSTTLTLAAGTYLLRVAETDNRGFFQQGVDNVSVQATVPEPGTWLMLLVGFGTVGTIVRKTRSVRRAVAA